MKGGMKTLECVKRGCGYFEGEGIWNILSIWFLQEKGFCFGLNCIHNLYGVM